MKYVMVGLSESTFPQLLVYRQSEVVIFEQESITFVEFVLELNPMEP